MVTSIVESNKALKDLRKAPKEVLLFYEAWARLIEEHGHEILREFKGYHDEKLSGKLDNCRSSRLNKKWRVIYQLTKSHIEIVEVKRVTPHLYRL